MEKGRMEVRARAPNRIDLAGGTLDIHPLYIFEGGGLTVNAAVQVYSTAEIQANPGSHVKFSSQDLNQEISFPSLQDCIPDGELELLVRAVHHFPPAGGIKITTNNEAPHGSGLGASSALLMAILSVLNRYNETAYSLPEMIEIAANLEAQTIRIPTGKQDYLAASHGGINAFWFKVEGIQKENISYSEKEIQEFESRLILSYTGVPHFSGENNWAIVRRYVDGDPETVHALKEIKTIAFTMREALLQRDWKKIGETLNEEWENRKKLASGVTTETVDHLIREARKAGAKANKLCGAGGGGCMITWVEPSEKKHVEKALHEEGAKILHCKIALHGLEVSPTGTGAGATKEASVKSIGLS